jgi:hypothetical protein
MNYIYIDANIYLRFYLGNKLFKLLEVLVDNKNHVIVTEQISNEVFRNSVSVNADNLKTTILNLKWLKPSLPYNNASADTIKNIDETFRKASELKKMIESDVDKHLTLVASQKDAVSMKLNELFSVALIPTSSDIENAEKLKKFGNPPGKKSDPIGDELSWTQLISKLNENDNVVIVTNDRDYAKEFNGKLYINSQLNQTLEKKKITSYIYSEINDGIKKFTELQLADKSAFEAKDIPTEEEYKEISKEEQIILVQNSIPECKLMVFSMITSV